MKKGCGWDKIRALWQVDWPQMSEVFKTMAERQQLLSESGVSEYN